MLLFFLGALRVLGGERFISTTPTPADSPHTPRTAPQTKFPAAPAPSDSPPHNRAPAPGRRCRSTPSASLPEYSLPPSAPLRTRPECAQNSKRFRSLAPAPRAAKPLARMSSTWML